MSGSTSIQKYARAAGLLGCLVGCSIGVASQQYPNVAPLEIADYLPFVTATIGTEKLRLRFDSGAYNAGIGLTPDELKRVRVDYSGSLRNMDAMGNISAVRKFVVPEVRIANLRLASVPGNELVFAANYAPPGSTGHVGMASLRSFLLVVDFAARRIEFRRSSDFPESCGAQEASLFADPVGLVSIFRSADRELRILWDTASQSNIIKPSALNVQPGFEMGEPKTLTGSIFINETGTTEFKLVDIQIPGVDGVFGYDYFAQHVVCLDLKAGRVRSKRIG